MLNLSGILKKYKEKKTHQHPSSVPHEGSAPAPINTPFCPPGPGAGDDAPGAAWYTRTRAAVAEVYRPGIRELSAEDVKVVWAAAGSLVEHCKQYPAALMKCVFSDYPSDASYLPAHALNVAVLCCRFGGSIGYTDDRLVRLAAAALLHDIGMLSVMHVAGKREQLRPAERDEIRKHPRQSRALLEKFYGDLTEDVVETVAQEHERIDGSGYPGGLSGNSVREFAQVLGICDVYEAITHSRPYRCHSTPVDAIKGLLGMKNGFQRKLLKGFIESVGIFPAGALVRLNTREVAVVSAVNAGSPLRPVVTVLFDAHGGKITEPRRLDLSDHSIIHIEDCLEETPCP